MASRAYWVLMSTSHDWEGIWRYVITHYFWIGFHRGISRCDYKKHSPLLSLQIKRPGCALEIYHSTSVFGKHMEMPSAKSPEFSQR